MPKLTSSTLCFPLCMGSDIIHLVGKPELCFLSPFHPDHPSEIEAALLSVLTTLLHPSLAPAPISELVSPDLLVTVHSSFGTEARVTSKYGLEHVSSYLKPLIVFPLQAHLRTISFFHSEQE